MAIPAEYGAGAGDLDRAVLFALEGLGKGTAKEIAEAAGLGLDGRRMGTALNRARILGLVCHVYPSRVSRWELTARGRRLLLEEGLGVLRLEGGPRGEEGDEGGHERHDHRDGRDEVGIVSEAEDLS